MTKTERLVARISPEDKAVLERAAELEGRSVASFVVTHLREHARKILAEHATLRLTEEESRRFVQALRTRPRRPTQAMKKAVERYGETVIEG